MDYQELIDKLFLKTAGWIYKDKQGNLQYDLPGDDGLIEALYEAEGAQDYSPEAEKTLRKAVDYGNRLVREHPNYQNVLNDLQYEEDRNKIHSPLSAPVSYGLLAGVPAGAVLGVRSLNKKLKVPLGKNMGKTIAGGLIGGLMAGGAAGNAIDKRKKAKMGYPSRSYDNEWNMAEDIDKAVNEKYWPKNATEAIDNLYLEKLADDMSLGGGGRFSALSSKLQRQGHSKKSADAIAASIGRKKYGKKRMASMSEAGKTAAETYALEKLAGNMSPSARESYLADYKKLREKMRQKKEKKATELIDELSFDK
jgi:hypothetical protein